MCAFRQLYAFKVLLLWLSVSVAVAAENSYTGELRNPPLPLNTNLEPPKNFTQDPQLRQLIAQKIEKKALVIGNSAYQEARLNNPVNDARAIALALQELGFDVDAPTDLTLQSMDEAIERFSQQLKQGGIGVFYYAGHGVQVDGENYLIPIDAQLNQEKDARYQAVPLGEVVNAMEAARTRVNILIIDACRDNPFSRRWRSSSRGLSTVRGLETVEVTQGWVIAFATAPGEVAEDGVNSNNSPFTHHLLRNIKNPNEDVVLMLRKVRNGVLQATNNSQKPWVEEFLVEPFYFNPVTSTPSSSPSPSPQPTTVTKPTPSSLPSPHPQRQPTTTIQPTPTPQPTTIIKPIPSPSPQPTAVIKPTSTPTPSPQPTTAMGGSATEWLNRGVNLWQKQDYSGAVNAYTESISLNPNNADAYNNRGFAYAKLEDYSKAINDFTQAIRLNPYNAKAYYNRGFAYGKLNQYEKAIEDYTQAIRLNPNNVDAYDNRGFAYARLRQYQKAVEDYSQVIRFKPNDATTYYNRAIAYYSLRDYQKAIEDYSQIIRLNPNDKDAYYHRGTAYSDLQAYSQAIEDYTQAIRLNPSNAIIYKNRGFAYGRLEDYQNAINDYTQAIRLDPNDAYAYDNRGNAYGRLKDYGNAIADFQKAAALYQQQGKINDAKRLLELIRQIEHLL